MALWSRLKEKLKGVTERWSGGIAGLFSGRSIDDAFWEELEERLIAGDVGISLTERLLERLRDEHRTKRIRETEALRNVFVEILVELLESVPGMGAPLRSDLSPSVVLLIGVNGSGKTTTAGKLAFQAKHEGRSVLLAAADTYRAAAIDQLKIWGERTGIRVIAQEPGSDSAAVVFDAVRAARASDCRMVIADTAGRLHTKHNLMEELQKVHRVVSREIPEGPAEVLLVLDAVMGQNAFRQAEAFNAALPLTGIVLTKYDNTAKGGILLSVVDSLHLPIRYVGLGETAEDLQLFAPRNFVETLLKEGKTDEPVQ